MIVVYCMQLVIPSCLFIFYSEVCHFYINCAKIDLCFIFHFHKNQKKGCVDRLDTVKGSYFSEETLKIQK